MSKNKAAAALADELRRCAEQRLAQGGEASVNVESHADIMKLAHELQVHQIELEMQGEALLVAQDELDERRRFTDLFQFAPVAYFIVAPDSTIHLLNLAGASLLGMPSTPLHGQRLAAYVAADSLPTFNAFLARVFAERGRAACELNLRPMGTSALLAVLVEAVCDGVERSCNLAISDISALKRAEEALREQKEFFRLIAENVDGFIAVLDNQGRRIYNSPSYARLVGEQDISGTVSFADVHPADRELVEQAFCETIATGVGKHLEYRFMMADGGIRLMESHGGVVLDSEGRVKYVVVVSHDITERRAADEKIHHLAFYDPLTQLPNRLTLHDRLQHAMAASKRSGRYGALIFLDLDNFKPVNDIHGHGAGDLLLVQAAERIASCVREVDTVSRFGGDEFVVVVGELDVDFEPSLAQAALVAEKIRGAIAEPYLLDLMTGNNIVLRIEHRCTASIGVTLFLNHERSDEDVIKLADIAMYRAKEGGRDRVFYMDNH